MRALHLRLLPDRRAPSEELAAAAVDVLSAINGMRGACSDRKRRHLFAAGERLGVALGKLAPSPKIRALPRNIQERVDATIVAIAEYALLEVSVVLGSSRERDVVDARDLLIYMLRHDLRLGPQAIGRQVNRDHSSVLTSLKRGEKKLEAEWFRLGISDVRRALDGVSEDACEVSDDADRMGY